MSANQKIQPGKMTLEFTIPAVCAVIDTILALSCKILTDS